MINLVISIAGVAAGITAAGLYRQFTSKSRKTEKALSVFGDRVYMDNFSMADIEEYKAEHKGCGKVKAARTDSKWFENMSEDLGLDFSADKYSKCILLAVYSKSGRIDDGIVVKYDTLDPDIESRLSRNNGQFTI